jgi:hypothetical protein
MPNLFDELLAEVSPEHANTAQLHTRIMGLLTDPTITAGLTHPDALGEVSAMVLDWAAGGQPVAGDILDQVARIQTRYEAFMLWRSGLNAALATAQVRREQAYGAAAGDVLARLAEHLNDLVGQINALRADLRGANSADAAIEAGSKATAAWTALQQHVISYRQIRDAQVQAYRHAAATRDLVQVRTACWAAGQIRNFVEAEPYWTRQRRNVAASLRNAPAHARTDGAGQNLMRWASEDTQPLSASPAEHAAPLPAVDQAQFLLEITSKGQPWLPDPDTLAQAWDLANKAHQEPRDTGSIAGRTHGVITINMQIERSVEALTRLDQFLRPEHEKGPQTSEGGGWGKTTRSDTAGER